jgi:hypothetical protein
MKGGSSMAVRKHIATWFSAGLLLALLGLLSFAAEPPAPNPAPEPTPTDTPTFSEHAQCAYGKTIGEICCAGQVTGVEDADAVVRIKGLAHCVEKPESKAVVLTGESTVKPVKGILDFKDVCTKAPTTTDCPATMMQEYEFFPILSVTVEQPKGTALFPMPALGVRFP